MVGLFKFELVAQLSVFVYYQSILIVLLLMFDTQKLVLSSSPYSKVMLAFIGVT